MLKSLGIDSGLSNDKKPRIHLSYNTHPYLISFEDVIKSAQSMAASKDLETSISFDASMVERSWVTSGRMQASERTCRLE